MSLGYKDNVVGNLLFFFCLLFRRCGLSGIPFWDHGSAFGVAGALLSFGAAGRRSQASCSFSFSFSSSLDNGNWHR